MADKPARMLEKLLAQTKADAKRISELERQLQQSHIDKAKCIGAALDEANAEADERINSLNQAHKADWEAAEERLKVFRQQYEDVNRTLGELREELDEYSLKSEAQDAKFIKLTQLHQETVTKLQEAEAKVAEAEPRLALLAQQREELNHLLDSVRDRMRRKEADEERAILNRKALTGALPQARSKY